MDLNIDLQWTTTLIQELFALGVSYFCLSPGSRSTPLALSLHAHPRAKTFVHFDERAMAFHALGYAKASKQPVAIIVTSATATGNLLPAIMEAHESAIPLLILTADRPEELQECGANQTTNQISMFQNYVRWQCALPVPTPTHSLDYLKTTLAHAVAKATYPHPGPVHLNCPFREPFSLSYSIQPAVTVAKTQLIPVRLYLEESSLQHLSNALQHAKQGLILLGYEALHTHNDLSAVCMLAEQLGWPILCDVLSQARSHPLSIPHYDLAWEMIAAQGESSAFYPDCVLHFGGAFVSKHVLTFLKNAHPATYIHCLPYPKRQDPMHLITHRVSTTPHQLCSQLSSTLSTCIQNTYFLQWKNLSRSIQRSLHEIFSEPTELSEAQLSYLLASYDLSRYALFLPSSMPIRNCTQFFYPQTQAPHTIYGNRGLSGIDGNIATAVGIAEAIQSPMLTLLGDQAFLHDLTSLHQLKKLKHPMIILVINNDGGTIFSFLPIYTQKEICQQYFINPHGMTFACVAELFELPYHFCNCLEEVKLSLECALSSSQHHLIEVKTDLETNLKIHRMIKQRLLADAALTMLR
jgi:2-succinyl-5-enolpyruvyl-6-hydroxy-3-cyclohexene-1-carboxylate synthase